MPCPTHTNLAPQNIREFAAYTVYTEREREREREMMLDRGSIDLVLVPAGLAILFGYHLFLLYRIFRFPDTTVIGYENHNKRAWVERMLQQSTTEEVGIALQVIASNITASSNLASLSIALSSLIGTWIGGSSKVLMTEVIYGDTSQTTSSVKYVSLLICFLAAFTCFIHSARYFVHASFMMSTLDSDIPVSYVQTAVIRGSNFWSMGLRAMYFATSLLLWIFGPIPMFTCSVLMVMILHFLDTSSTPLHQFRYYSNKGVERRLSRRPASDIKDNPMYSSAPYIS